MNEVVEEQVMQIMDLAVRDVPDPAAVIAGPTPGEIRLQLHSLRSGAFAGSGKLFDFLRFIVEESLEGRSGGLKEIVIGHALYRGVNDYDPRIDSAVRVEARRLRRKLEDHYAGAGAYDAVLISMPVGGYLPRFSIGETASPARSGAYITDAPCGRAALAVLPFTALSIGMEEESFAEGVTDEIIYAAERHAGFRVASRAVTFQFRGSRFTLESFASRTRADLILHGTIRRVQDRRRVAVELTNSMGAVLWSERVDVAGDCDLAAQERTAEAIFGLLSDPHAIELLASSRCPVGHS